METAQYVSKVGKLINDCLKYSAKMPKADLKNLVLYNHLVEVYSLLETEEDRIKIGGYINCLKKEISFYPIKDIDEDCILTEVEELIIQE